MYTSLHGSNGKATAELVVFRSLEVEKVWVWFIPRHFVTLV